MSIFLRILRRATVRTGLAIARRRWVILGSVVVVAALIAGFALDLISLPAPNSGAGSSVAEARVPGEPEATAMFFQGHKTFDARLVWNAYSEAYNRARERQGIDLDQMQRQLEEVRRRGERIESAQFVASYPVQNGKMAFYAVTKVGVQRGDVETLPYAFMLDGDGKIVAVY